MKIGLVSSCVPLVFGGDRNIVDWLALKLQERGHDVEAMFIPNTDDPDFVLEQMAAFRLLELEQHFERVITFRPPAHLVRHSHKVVWFIHHLRFFYDLWDSPYHDFPKTAPVRAIRDRVIDADTKALAEARAVFTNSQTVSRRLLTFNGIKSEVLYPPVLAPEQFRAGAYGDEIVCIGRMEPHKRQHLLVEAMRFVQSAVRLRLCGLGNPQYVRQLHETVAREGLSRNTVIEDRWVTEQEKAELLGSALANAYVPFDEDSYGYSTIEAACARRCTVTLADAGGVLEFVTHGDTGYVEEADPAAIAAAFDRLYRDRVAAQTMGTAARDRLDALGINWDTTIRTLLG